MGHTHTHTHTKINTHFKKEKYSVISSFYHLSAHPAKVDY